MAETRSTCCPNQEEESSLKNRPSNLPIWGFVVLISLVAVVSAALVIIWVMIFPKVFDVDVEDMRAPYYHITPAKYLNATFNFTIAFNNPNRMLTIYYRWFNVTIERDNQTLAFKEFHQPFAQPPRDVTLLRGTTKKSSSGSGDRLNDTTLENLKPISAEDISTVDVRIMTRIQFWTKYWGSKGHVVWILCSDVRVHPPNYASPSTLTPCRVDL